MPPGTQQKNLIVKNSCNWFLSPISTAIFSTRCAHYHLSVGTSATLFFLLFQQHLTSVSQSQTWCQFTIKNSSLKKVPSHCCSEYRKFVCFCLMFHSISPVRYALFLFKVLYVLFNRYKGFLFIHTLMQQMQWNHLCGHIQTSQYVRVSSNLKNMKLSGNIVHLGNSKNCQR